MGNRLNIIVSSSSKAAVNDLISSISDDGLSKISRTFEDPETLEQKEVFFNYGLCKLDNDTTIALLNARKTSQFQYFEARQSTGLQAMVLLLDANRLTILEQLIDTLTEHKRFVDDFALIIGVCNVNATSSYDKSEVNKILKDNNLLIPVYQIDPQKQSDVGLMIESLIAFNNPQAKTLQA